MNESPPLPRNRFNISMVEIVVALSVLGCLVGLGWTVLKGVGMRAVFSMTLSDMKQLQLATQQMAIDGEMGSNTLLGLPGDTGGTFTNWMAQLVPGYLTTNDFCHLISVRGRREDPAALPEANTNTILVYAVSSNSSRETVFLSTANFTNTLAGGIFNPSALPNGNSGIVIFRQGGDGAVLKGRQAGDANAVGAYAPLLK